MSLQFQMQARSSTDGLLYTWLSATPDFEGAAFPGPGVAEHVAVATRVSSDDGGESTNAISINGNRVPWKATARAAATSNVTKSGPRTIDGVSCVADDRVLLSAQTSGPENGLWIVKAGAWSRAEDMASSADCIVGSIVAIAEGTAFRGSSWKLATTSAITLGSTALHFYRTDNSTKPEQFGAKGDGVTDDAIPLQAAINAGGQVVLTGEYLTSASIALVSDLQITALPGATVKAKDATTFNAVFTGTSIENVSIFGLTVDANGSNRTDTANTKDGFRIVGLTDATFENVTVKNTLGTPGSAVGYALTTGLRVRYINCIAIDCGAVGRISDGWYSNGDQITYLNCFAIRCQDTGFVFENASHSGGVGLHVDGLIASAAFTFNHTTDRLLSTDHELANDTQIKLYTDGAFPVGFTAGSPVYVINRTADDFQVSASLGGSAITFTTNGTGTHTWKHFAGAGIAIGTAGNTDKADNSFTAVTIKDVIAPVEFGLFGANTNTGDIKNTTFDDVTIDCPGAGFAAFLFYPNPQVNPTSLTYGGRIVNTTISNCKIPEANGLQGIYATQCDELTIKNCDFNLTAAAVQTAEGNPTKITIRNNDFDVDAVFGLQFATGCDDVVVSENRIRGSSSMAWAMYFFGTSTNIRTGRNEISGSAMNDQSGIGADAATQPRSHADGPDWVTTTPQPATGIWPVGYMLRNKTAQVTEDTSHPEGWIVTTAGVPGSGAVFTPFFREGRTAGEAGTLNTANAVDHVRTPASGGDYAAYNARGDSADASKYVGYAFSNASNAAGNLGYLASDGNGNLRLSALAGLTIGFNTNANFPGVFTGVLDFSAKGWRALVAQGGYFMGSSAQYGGVQHGTDVASGVVYFAASLRGELGISSGNAPWSTGSTWIPGLYWRKSASTAFVSIGIGVDPSDVNANLTVKAPSTGAEQVHLRKGVAPSALLEGGLSHIDGTGLTFCYGTVTRYNVALKVVDIAYNFNTTVNATTTSDITISGVTGALVGDKVLIDFGSAGITAGLLVGGAWVSTSGTVKVRVHNPTGGNITPNDNWNVTVIHT